MTASLRGAGLWNHKFINAGFGTVFDKLVIPPGGGYAIEVKVRKEPKIAYNLKSITQNERKGLDNFMKKVGENNAFIIGIWTSLEGNKAFLIPWKEVRDQVCSGIRGSINMLDFPELKKIGSKWDMSYFGEVRCEEKKLKVKCIHQLDYWEEECSKCDGSRECRKAGDKDA